MTETPSDAQLTDDARREVDAQHEADRRDDTAEDKLTAAQPVEDDPAATPGEGSDEADAGDA